MGHQDGRWINQTGQNLIRIIIGSYFIASSLDFVQGVDKTALFSTFLDFKAADMVGSTALLAISVCFMIGANLRVSALMLAMFVFSSSLVQNFIHFEAGNISNFWRDLTMVCAVMLNYSNLNADDLYDAAIVARRVKPRRIATDNATRRTLQREIQSALAVQKTPRPSPMATRRINPLPDPAKEPETGNIFANV